MIDNCTFSNITALSLINQIFSSFFYLLALYSNRNFKIIPNNVFERRKSFLFFLNEFLITIVIIIVNVSIS